MAPTRSLTIRASKQASPESRRNPKPPAGYNHKRVVAGLESGVLFKKNYEGMYDGPGPYHSPVSALDRMADDNLLSSKSFLYQFRKACDQSTNAAHL
jgi:hypothetical protein